MREERGEGEGGTGVEVEGGEREGVGPVVREERREGEGGTGVEVEGGEGEEETGAE